VQAKLTVCRVNTGAVPPASTQPAPATQPLSPAARKVHAKPQPGETRPLDIKELGNFEYDPERGGGLPADVQQLSGLSVRMTGFMVPLKEAESITEFALVPSLGSCCFGAPPQIQHTILVHCPASAKVGFSGELIVVEGALRVEEKREENYTVSLFEMQAKTVKAFEIRLSPADLSGRKPRSEDLNSAK